MSHPDASNEVAESGFPLTVDELTTDWLQSAMADALGDAKIEAFFPEIIGVKKGPKEEGGDGVTVVALKL